MSDILDRIMRGARTRLPGSLNDAIKEELFLVLDEFLQRSTIWQEEITFKVTPDDTEYVVVPAAGTIIRLLYVTNSDETPVRATMQEPFTIVLKEEPNADTFTAKVALTVVDPTTRDYLPEVPEWILVKYHGIILDGVIGRMMTQPAKPYTTERHAVYHTRRFRNGIVAATAEAKRKNVYGAQSWNFPQQFAVRRRR